MQKNNGLFQGEVLSPILLSTYVNECEMHLMAHTCPYINLHIINVFLIMFTDDMVLIAEKAEGLQNMIKSLFNYTSFYMFTYYQVSDTPAREHSLWHGQ